MNTSKLPPIRFTIITGSERADGNTDQVAKHIETMLSEHGCETDVVYLRKHRIAPCGSCGDCNTREIVCCIDDDMPALVARLHQADAIVYAVPVHGYGMAHQMQIFIERAGVGYLRFKRPLANKVAGAVVTGRRYAHEAVFHQLISNILLNRMILVGSGYPVVLHGGSPGAGMTDVEGLVSVHSLIFRMIGMARLLRETSPDIRNRLLSLDVINERAA